jgi:GNAT superfamily N-acetyltransferase
VISPAALAGVLDDDPRALRIRPLRRGDDELLDRILAGMSDQSRYRRFHSPKPRLTAADRARLMDVEGRDHLALVAFAADGAPIGVARAVRVGGEPIAAEVAVAVVDARQGQGVGTELVRRLARCAAAAGIERLVADVLAETTLATSLARRGWRLIARDGHTLTLDARVWHVSARPAFL